MTYASNGVNSKSFINALAKAKREMTKVEYDAEQTRDVAEIVSKEYFLTKEETESLIEKLEKYVDKMNDIYSLPFEEFVKWVEKSK